MNARQKMAKSTLAVSMESSAMKNVCAGMGMKVMSVGNVFTVIAKKITNAYPILVLSISVLVVNAMKMETAFVIHITQVRFVICARGATLVKIAMNVPMDTFSKTMTVCPTYAITKNAVMNCIVMV